MTRDRLPEFLLKANINNDGESSDGDMDNDDNCNDICLHIAIPVPTQVQQRHNAIDLFTSLYSDTLQMMCKLKLDVEKVKVVHRKLLSLATLDEDLQSELNELMTTVTANSQLIEAKLKDIEKLNNTEDNGSASATFGKAQHSAMLRNFIEIMDQYQHQVMFYFLSHYSC